MRVVGSGSRITDTPNHPVCYTSYLGQRIETSFKVVFVYPMFT